MIPTVLEPLAESAFSYVTANPEQSIGLVVGLFGVGFNYSKTGKFPIGRIPYRHAREMIRDLGDKYFRVSRPRGIPVVVAHAPPKKVKRALENRHYESADLVSYEYDGETFNVRRPEGHDVDPEHGGDVLMENHVRGFECDDGDTLLLTHYEANRYLETKEHLADQGLTWTGGRDRVIADLEMTEIEYTEYENEANADLTVVS